MKYKVSLGLGRHANHFPMEFIVEADSIEQAEREAGVTYRLWLMSNHPKDPVLNKSITIIEITAATLRDYHADFRRRFLASGGEE